ncbi:MAG: efflux RND transporter periplasmic adaptor subunit [Chlamydiae bacterium]|nr:efflux RND transporter periplasmic adaptor subunit [Chlamydiota bacterium]
MEKLDSTQKKRIIFFGAGALFVFLLLFSYFFRTEKKAGCDLIIYGNVDIRQVDLGFRVPGKVQTLLFEEGDEIKQGQLMAMLEKTPYEEDVWQAKANLSAVEATLQGAKARVEKRSKAIGSAAISREIFDDALFSEESLQANFQQAKAGLASATTRYEDTELYAPSNGMILTRIREPGSVINAGEPVYTLSIDSPVWVRTYVSEPNLGKIYPGMQAEVYTDTKTNPTYYGHIGFISPVAEFTPKTVETTELRSDLVYRLRVIVDNPDRGLRQGMPVTIRLKCESEKQ